METLVLCIGIVSITLLTLCCVSGSLITLDVVYCAVKKWITGRFVPIHPKTVLIPSIVFAVFSCPILYATGCFYADRVEINFGAPEQKIERINFEE